MQVELVSVERALWSGEATAVFARTVVGQLGILPGHTPLLGALAPGYTVRIDREGEDSLTVAVHGGFLSVRKDGVSVLAEMAETVRRDRRLAGQGGARRGRSGNTRRCGSTRSCDGALARRRRVGLIARDQT